MDFGIAYFVPESPFNIVPFSQMKSLFVIRYDHDNDKFECEQQRKKRNHRETKSQYEFKFNRTTRLYRLSSGDDRDDNKDIIAEPLAKGRKRKRETFDIENKNSIVLTPEQIERADEAAYYIRVTKCYVDCWMEMHFLTVLSRQEILKI
jgi:hypothetical protein